VKRKIPCFCDNTFDIDAPDEIDLDSNPGYFEEIQNGTFMNFTCPACGKKHKPEFPLSVLWPSKKLYFEIFPELDRGEFYRRKKEPPSKGPLTKETIIGYPELADRLALIRDGFNPAAAEALKYYLHLKAEEQYPDDEIDIWYFGSTGDSLEFHIHGIRQQEVAVMKVPLSLYKKTLEDYKKHPKSEIFGALRVRTYLSVKNTMRAEELK
jgi:hypothetical protein